MKALAALILAIVVALLHAPASASSTADRASSCEAVALAFCDAMAVCEKRLPGHIDGHNCTGAACRRAELERCGTGPRGALPGARQTVDAGDGSRCLLFALGPARATRDACDDLLTGFDPRDACGDFYGEARGVIYTPSTAGHCGPEHHVAGATCAPNEVPR